MRASFPAEWETVERELRAVVDTGDRAALTAYARQLATPAPVRPGSKPSRSGLDAKTAATVRQHMAAAWIRNLSLSAATGVESGTVRFGKREGTIIQKLLFAQGLERKPVSLRTFRLLWPRLSERRRLMPLVQPQGIYCFYSSKLVRELGNLIDGRPALEIAAGDGTLSRFLRDAGTDITATDDHSWSAVSFPEDVEKLDASKALATYRPEVVLCSWPPAGNTFESAVFRTPSVDTYVVIGNRSPGGWGDHTAYTNQRDFDLIVDERLSELVLPPEIEPLVYVFRRAATEAPQDA
ncbi:MAG: hypothetical protein AAGC46_09005 [Solirubrobacteraceae bacterium]